MAIITGRRNVTRVYEQAQERGWILPCFNSENLTTTEAILEATSNYGGKIGINNLPIMIGITAKYPERPQSIYYTNTRKWDIGLRIFLKELKVLAGEGGPYSHLQVLIHLDHIIHDLDKELLEWDLSQFSSIMYDASNLPFEENIKETARFVEKNSHLLLIEGACDEIKEADENNSSNLTTPEKAEHYCKMTGVDMVVANLGTEHRASLSELKYRGDYARKIKSKIGNKIVLHGGSSVEENKLAHLIDDGVIKVNIWTLLERESTPELFNFLIKNATKVIGEDNVKQLQEEGWLGSRCLYKDKVNLDYYSTTARQQIIYEKMKEVITKYLCLWYTV